MSTSVVITLVVIALLVGAAAGYALGYKRGHASGWLDHYFKTVRDDRARRDRQGKFVAVRAKEAASS